MEGKGEGEGEGDGEGRRYRGDVGVLRPFVVHCADRQKVGKWEERDSLWAERGVFCRRKIRLIECKAKCCYLKKLTCNLRQVFYLSEASSLL
jgi:hypothetical protein